MKTIRFPAALRIPFLLLLPKRCATVELVATVHPDRTFVVTREGPAGAPKIPGAISGYQTTRIGRWLRMGRASAFGSRNDATTRCLGQAAAILFLMGAAILTAEAQYQFRTEVNPDGTLTVYKTSPNYRQGCPAGALVIPDTIDGRPVTSIGFEAFRECTGLTSITIPDSVTSIGRGGFSGCRGLHAAYFGGDAPAAHEWTFSYMQGAFPPRPLPISAYYLPGTEGWGPTFCVLDTAHWHRPYPTILDFGDRFGPTPDGFSFVISWAINVPVVVEASADLAEGWTPISTNTLTHGWVQFTDPNWAQEPARFYRVRGQ